MKSNTPHRYRAIITDVDGTAVKNSIHAIPSKRVRSAIAEAKKQGYSVSVSTGRPLKFAKGIIRALGISDPCAVNDATQLYDPICDEVIETFPLSDVTALNILDILKHKNIRFMVNTGQSEEFYVGEQLPSNICGFAIPDRTLAQAEELITSLSHISEISIHKVPSYKKEFVWVSITSPVATKLHSVYEISKRLNIDTADIIGIGDGYNDYPLLSACGLKVAMGNAVDELKEIADFIAPTVEEDGLAIVIEKFLLQK